MQQHTVNAPRGVFLTEYGKQKYITQSLIEDINTAIPVTVTGVETTGVGLGGYVDVKPLIQRYDNDKKAIANVDVFHLPYFRLQGGKCAIVCDPCVGDIGLAVFAQRDCSKIQPGETKEVTVNSFRQYSMSDGFYIGGFLAQEPKLYIELTQEGKIILHPTSSAADAVKIEGNTTIKGNLCVAGRIYSDDSEGVNCDVYIKGKIDATGDIKAGTVSLEHHTHGGVDRGGGNTDEPNTN